MGGNRNGSKGGQFAPGSLADGGMGANRENRMRRLRDYYAENPELRSSYENDILIWKRLGIMPGIFEKILTNHVYRRAAMTYSTSIVILLWK